MSPRRGPDPLEVVGVSVHFGGLQALDKVSIRVGRGEIVGLIGPNGAGKTTLMDAISGYVRLKGGGSIKVFGQEVAGLPPELRVYAGLGRSYQDARLFPGLSVEEALLVAIERHAPTRLLPALLRRKGALRAEAAKREWLEEIIATSGLESFRYKFIRELSTGTRRVVDVVSILAQGPKLLLLDEPSAGVAQAETEALAPLLRRIKSQLECAILIVEHDMPLVSHLSDRMYALEAGEVIAEGSPKAVLSDPKVVASYLGTDVEAITRSGRRAPKRGKTKAKARRATRKSGGRKKPNGKKTRSRATGKPSPTAAVAGVGSST